MSLSQFDQLADVQPYKLIPTTYLVMGTQGGGGGGCWSTLIFSSYVGLDPASSVCPPPP